MGVGNRVKSTIKDRIKDTILRSTAVVSFALVVTLALAGVLPSAVAAAGEGAEGGGLSPLNGVPLVIVRVDESSGGIAAAKSNDSKHEYGDIAAMNKSAYHSVRCVGTVEIKVPEGYSCEYAPGADISSLAPAGEMKLDYIRGRGNSTWDSNKKPYKIKLDKKEDLFGMGESKEWALMSNCMDSSLLRNRISAWLGERLGFAYTPRQVPVDLVIIGTGGDETHVYRYGSYCLSELVSVEESRVNIDELKKKDTDNVTGGYLLALYSDQGKDIPQSTIFTTNHGVSFMCDTPEYDDSEDELKEGQKAQLKYIRSYMQELEDLIMAPGEIGSARHKAIAERMDLVSAADYWWLQEFPFNTDGFNTTSSYLYKERDGKLYWGPLWDNDNAWNNSGIWTDLNLTLNNTYMLWIAELRDRDPEFANLLRERWTLLDMGLAELTRQGGVIDQYRAGIAASQRADYEIWSMSGGGLYKGESPDEYNAEIEAMKSWIDERRAWVNRNLAQLNKPYCTVRYELEDGTLVATERVAYDHEAVMDPDAPAPNGKVFDHWVIKGGMKTISAAIREDTIFVPMYVEESAATAPDELVFQFNEEESADLSKGFFPDELSQSGEYYTLEDAVYVAPYGTVTNPRITWTSSDESVGVIDPVNKRVILKSEGDTTITGTLYNGISASFVLHVTKPDGWEPTVIPVDPPPYVPPADDEKVDPDDGGQTDPADDEDGGSDKQDADEAAAKAQKVAIGSVKALKGRKAKISWKKAAGASGYQIRCSTKKSFKKGTKKIGISKAKTTSKTLKKLRAGKTYYVQVRSYRKLKDKKSGKTRTVYGKWSKTKKFKARR